MRLSRNANEKKKILIEKSPEYKEIEGSLQKLFVSEYGKEIYERMSQLKVSGPMNEQEKKIYEKLTYAFSTYPLAVHYVLNNGENLIQFAINNRRLGLIFKLIKENGKGLEEICTKKLGEKEALCFSILASDNIETIKEMNEYLESKKIEPISANDEKWSTLCAQKLKELERRQEEINKEFKVVADERNSQLKYFNRGLQK